VDVVKVPRDLRSRPARSFSLLGSPAPADKLCARESCLQGNASIQRSSESRPMCVGVTATNSLEVCALHRKNCYDLIVLDLQMPGMDGFQVMDGLKADGSEDYLPVIVLTAQPAHKLRALQAGARDFISKPFELVEVKTRIRNMLEVRMLNKKLASYNKVLEQRTLHDSTTGLPNRDLFDDRLRHAIALAKRHTWMLAVMFLDLDRFKCINDTHGHAVGDRVLKKFSV
jgi:two-component system cell cycle response regulator